MGQAARRGGHPERACAVDDYIYLLERALRKTVHQELKAGRRVMVYVEQPASGASISA